MGMLENVSDWGKQSHKQYLAKKVMQATWGSILGMKETAGPVLRKTISL